jgi:hypothetical protein
LRISNTTNKQNQVSLSITHGKFLIDKFSGRIKIFLPEKYED